jgi:hypothetical protein
MLSAHETLEQASVRTSKEALRHSLHAARLSLDAGRRVELSGMDALIETLNSRVWR